MRSYDFEITWAGGEKRGWTYLPTDDKARSFAGLLIRDFKHGTQYPGSARMVVKDNEGGVIASIQF